MSAVPPRPASRFGDPRYYQIAVLTGLLTYGTLVLEFDIRPWQIPLTLAVSFPRRSMPSVAWAANPDLGIVKRAGPSAHPSMRRGADLPHRLCGLAG